MDPFLICMDVLVQRKLENFPASFAAFFIHSSVRSFIQNFSLFNYLLQKKVSLSESSLNISGPPYDEIQGKGMFGALSNLVSLLMRSALKIHHHQNINITVRCRATQSIRAEQRQYENVLGEETVKKLYIFGF